LYLALLPVTPLLLVVDPKELRIMPTLPVEELIMPPTLPEEF
jgi:hypothetical protein